MAKAKYNRSADGYFQTKVWDGTYTADGAKHRVTLRSSQSSRALEMMVNDMAAKVEARQYTISTDMSFQAYAQAWLTIYKSCSQKNTQLMYSNIINVHFACLSRVPLSSFNRSHVILCLNPLRDKQRTQEQCLMTLKAVVRSAVADKFLPGGSFDDIFRDISVKHKKADEKRPLTEEEKKKVFTAPFTDQERAFVYLIYGCGLRRGEALALSLFDFDFKAKTVSINKSLQLFDTEEPDIKGTKNYKNRVVPLPDIILPFIESYAKQHPEALFKTAKHKYMTKSGYRRMWESIQFKMESPELTAHIFRHNYCTQLCYQIPAISINKVADLMGDTIKVIMDVYSHIIMQKEDAQNAVNNALFF